MDINELIQKHAIASYKLERPNTRKESGYATGSVTTKALDIAEVIAAKSLIDRGERKTDVARYFDITAPQLDEILNPFHPDDETVFNLSQKIANYFSNPKKNYEYDK